MKRSIYLIIYLITVILVPANVQAQENSSLRQVFTQAESDYRIGRLDQAIEQLQAHFEDFQGNLKQNACRLMAICYLAQDSIELSENYASLLLKENPYYTSVQDPIRFEEMINRLKTGSIITLTTASSHEESIKEAPVPVTIITRQMIDNVGSGKSLAQILSIFVPGMSEVSSYAMDNVSMHGVYTSGQEKILVMENGHRLNARSTNNGRMDYAISTEKIDHIEVLRGPASSLYGNVALTAVVNIITRTGLEVNGVVGKYGYGSYGTHKADLLAGTSFMGADVLAWMSVYASEGKEIFIPEGTSYTNTSHDGYAHIGRYQDKPSYDWGANLSLKDFRLMLNRKYSKQVPPYSWYGQVYDYNQYCQQEGGKPGYSIDETHLDLSFAKKLGEFNINLSAYGDWYSLTDYAVVTDKRVTYVIGEDGKPLIDDDGNQVEKLYYGLSQVSQWDENTLGGMAKADVSYSLAGMKGNLLAGGQYEFFKLSDTYMLSSENFKDVTLMLADTKSLIQTGYERSVSFFAQDKHYITPTFILNAGLRYDSKYRKNKKHVDAFSPRFALIYMPWQTFSTKLSYSRAFVDAPYFYRQNTAAAYKGSEDLMPEFMNAVQLDFLGTIPKYNLVYDINLYYNLLTDIINNTQSSDASSAKYRNSGKLKMAGIEAELNYVNESWMARLTSSYQYVLSAEDYYYSYHYIFGIPKFAVNANIGHRLLNLPGHRIWASVNIRYSSKTLNRAATAMPPRNSDDYYTLYLDALALIDAKLAYSYGNNIQMSVECNNILNTHYSLGGTSYFPYQRLGRTAMATISFKL
ncbi:MAG: TonB-dependent receptor [Prevotella sp.]|nr:TonB-dependent receptor [Prevotella sp.]